MGTNQYIENKLIYINQNTSKALNKSTVKPSMSLNQVFSIVLSKPIIKIIQNIITKTIDNINQNA